MSEKLPPLDLWEAFLFCSRQADRIQAVQSCAPTPDPGQMRDRDMYLRMAKFFEVIDFNEAAVKQCLREAMKRNKEKETQS